MLGSLIDALDTSKCHCVCVLCPSKCMIMCKSNFDHNYHKTSYCNMPSIIFYLFLTKIINFIYHSVALSLLY